MQLPAQLQAAIEQELATCDLRALRAASARLSAIYRNQFDGGPFLPAVGKYGVMADAADRAAYLAVRMPATFAAISAALAWTLEAVGAPANEIRSMLDLGSGPGTALWAAAQQLPQLEHCTALEREAELIELGRRLAAHSDSPALREAQWIRCDLTQWNHDALAAERKWDMVVCSYALNEVEEAHRAELIRRAWARCSKILLVVEPGTRSGFANILAVRQQMLHPCNPTAGLPGTPPYPSKPTAGLPGTPAAYDQNLAASPVLAAPCPHALDCPMAAASAQQAKRRLAGDPAGDWCHFAARVERTAAHRRIKDAAMGHEDEKFSYIAFVREQALGPQQARSALAGVEARMVRHPRIFAGHAQLTLCREGRLDQVTVTRSQKKDWRRLKRLGWGDAW